MVFHWVERGTFVHSTKWVQCPQEFITLYKGGHNSLDNKVPLQSSKGQLLLTIRHSTAFTRHCSQHRAVMEPKVRFAQKERMHLLLCRRGTSKRMLECLESLELIAHRLRCSFLMNDPRRYRLESEKAH